MRGPAVNIYETAATNQWAKDIGCYLSIYNIYIYLFFWRRPMLVLTQASAAVCDCAITPTLMGGLTHGYCIVRVAPPEGSIFCSERLGRAT
jgi:hypothetical protein